MTFAAVMQDTSCACLLEVRALTRRLAGQHSAGVKREGDKVASVRGRRRSRRRLGQLLFGPQPQRSLDYPGFFVLPRASTPTPTAPGKLSTRRVWSSRLKLTAVLLLGFGGFIGTLAYFFSQVAPELAEPPKPPAVVIFDPIIQPTNLGAGPERR